MYVYGFTSCFYVYAVTEICTDDDAHEGQDLGNAVHIFVPIHNHWTMEAVLMTAARPEVTTLRCGGYMLLTQENKIPEIPPRWIFGREKHPLKRSYFCWRPFMNFFSASLTWVVRVCVIFGGYATGLPG
ncbi:hypothetical protein BDM02DRAFT_1246556 [Thelephora ganbajun]|uniref:Uncharacterized protein n=1 Tax=Thelephora ganbajun TaxID=370292 RepID=A0ACB6Z3B4_THEGA|nr:hypothetical protein BDM02DRAFT_1246556 [Thelephora ganbajun]